MARQKGIIKIDGTIGDITFVKTRDGYIAKEKSEVSKDKILKDPAFERTRENGREFGNAAKAGKLLRMALKPLMHNTADARVTSRVTKIMTMIKNLDEVNMRGDRIPAEGLSNPMATTYLQSLDFNVNASLSTVVGIQMNADGAGDLDLGTITPLQDITYPQGTTHLSLTYGWANIDFTTGAYELQLSSELNIGLQEVDVTASLNIPTPPAGSGMNFHLLKVEFFQQINSVQYQLKNGVHNALGIVRIDG